jgi:uncharacterized protein (UPF0261 family)
MLPLNGVCAIDATGQAFDDPHARNALFDAIRESCGDVGLVEIEYDVNDAEFAEAAANRLLQLTSQKSLST